MLSPSMRFRPILAGLLLLISIDGRAQSQAAREEIQRILGPPLTPEQQRAADSYRTAEYLCRQKLESAPPDAIASCQDAVKVSKQLAPQRLIERSTVLSMLGQAFFVNRRFADALPQFEQAVEIRRQSGGSNNEGVAALLELVGLTHYALRDFPKANDAMQASILAYEGAIAELPSMKAMYTPGLQATLRRYADMKRALGDLAAADSLLKKANSLALTPVPSAPVEQLRIVDGVRLMGVNGARLTDDDLKKIRALMPPSAPPVWLIIGQRVGVYGPLSWDIEVYLQPDFTSPTLRIGRVATLTTRLPAADAFAANKTWAPRGTTDRYGQVPIPGHAPQEIRGEKDVDRPFLIIEPSMLSKFTNDEISRLIGFIRTEAAKTTPNVGRPRLSTDVQPWGIRHLTHTNRAEAEVDLIDPRSTNSQVVRMKFDASSVSIFQMR